MIKSHLYIVKKTSIIIINKNISLCINTLSILLIKYYRVIDISDPKISILINHINKWIYSDFEFDD